VEALSCIPSLVFAKKRFFPPTVGIFYNYLSNSWLKTI